MEDYPGSQLVGAFVIMSKKRHIGLITDQVTVAYTIECGICYEKETTDVEDSGAETPKKAAKIFFDTGWRYGVVKYHAAQGILCPACWFKRNKGKNAWED